VLCRARARLAPHTLRFDAIIRADQTLLLSVPPPTSKRPADARVPAPPKPSDSGKKSFQVPADCHTQFRKGN
jgi:hypothetical protein